MVRMLIVTGAVLILIGAAHGGGWVSEIVASAGDVGTGCALAVDRWGRPHIVYYDKTKREVAYARKSGSTWTFEVVASDVDFYNEAVLSLDAYDRPHVVFTNIKTNEVTYAYKNGNAWAVEPIDTGLGYGQHLAVYVWPTEIRAAYSRMVGYDIRLKYGYRDTGGWHVEDVTTSGSNGAETNLLVDEKGTPTIICHGVNSGDKVRILKRGASSWNFEDDIAPGMHPHAITGPDNLIYVSYAKPNNAGLGYAVFENNTWTAEDIGAATGQPSYNQICVNAQGHIYVTYWDMSTHDLKVVKKVNSSWQLETVATGAYLGYYHSAAMGPTGYPYVAYYHGDNGDLMFATYDPLTDIELNYLNARRDHEDVIVSWDITSAEILAGFNVYREDVTGARVKLNPVLVKGKGPYNFRDEKVDGQQTYYYLVEAVDLSGVTKTFGPAVVPPTRKLATFSLSQNHPNPAREKTTVKFNMPEPKPATLVIYDTSGRKVFTAFAGDAAAGENEVEVNTASLAPGVYTYRLDAGEYAATKKMVVVK